MVVHVEGPASEATAPVRALAPVAPEPRLVPVPALRVEPARPRLTGAIMLAADTLVLGVGLVAGLTFACVLDADVDLASYSVLWPLLGLFVLAYGAVGLYPGVGISPAHETRRQALATTLVFLALGGTAATFKVPGLAARHVLPFAWLVSLFAVPTARAIVRDLFAARPWWGYRVLILGAGKTGEMVIRNLQKYPGLGLKPLVVVDDDRRKHGDLRGVPVTGGLADASRLARELGISYAILAMPGMPRADLVRLLEHQAEGFHHLLVIPDLFGMSSLWTVPRDLGGFLGLEVKQQLLMTGPRVAKRALDLAMGIAGGLVLIPLVALLALAIKLESRGPVFYGNPRMGYGGKRFLMWKFRSMIADADLVLPRYLAENPAARAEWESTQKLRRDPRVTRVGRFLRKTSLDELPQLLNVLVGDMSLVGPRPLPPGELAGYGDDFSLYVRVKPGITGMWQVSGRNSVAYQDRVELNTYYVRNWSVWLDLYLLARTIPVVLFGRGAC